MSLEMKTIGVLTSGGDAPGMNAAIRAVVRTALFRGMRVVGIKRGYSGLINNDFEEMSVRSVSEIINRGGTVLYTARCDEFKTPQGIEKARINCIEAGINGLVCIGGDGTFRGAQELSNAGIPCVGIPATIDNDIACSEYAIGFDTALNTAMEMTDKLRDTIQSHHRCSVVEVMGRHAGYIALETGIACGSSAILVPEYPFDIEHDIIDRMQYTMRTGKRHFIIIVSEGCGNSVEIANHIQEATGIETRVTILGHVQRGGSPTNRDRNMASAFGARAVELLDANTGNRIVACKYGQIVDFDIAEALSMKKTIDKRLYDMSQMISI